MAAFDNQEMFETMLLAEGVTLRYKNESLYMRLLGALMFWNPTFMTRMTTTVGDTVFFPSRAYVEESYPRAWMTLAHELVHVEDYRNSKVPLFFMFTYGLPQSLSVLALLGFVFQSWWPLLFLLLLGPLPAPWRKNAEMRGYAMTMSVHCWAYRGGIHESLKEDIAKHFTGPGYWYMWPFKAAVKREINRWSKIILTDEIFDHGAIYGRVYKMITSRAATR